MSSTVTIAVFELEFPLTSVTVNVTVLSPTFEQLKLVVFKVIVSISQLSEEPLSIIPVVIFALPLESSCIVTF